MAPGAGRARPLAALLAWGAGDVLLSRLPWPYGAAAILAWALAGLALLMTLVLAEVSTTIRSHRHRMANRVQLVSGWLQLDRADEAERAVGSLLEGAEWFASLAPWGRVTMWWIAGRADRLGLEVRWPEAPAPSGRPLVAGLYMLAAALDVAASRRTGGTVALRWEDGEYLVTVSLEEPPGRLAWWCRGVERKVAAEAETWRYGGTRHCMPARRGG
jgi:hypothetical protein